MQGDAGTADGAIEISKAARSLLPALDILITSVAPDVEPTLFKDIPTSDIVRTLTSLALPAMLMASAALLYVRAQGGGTIVNVASDAGKTATPGESVIVRPRQA